MKDLTYIEEEDLIKNGSQYIPLFGGNESWEQREDSFKLKPSMKVELILYEMKIFSLMPLPSPAIPIFKYNKP